MTPTPEPEGQDAHDAVPGSEQLLGVDVAARATPDQHPDPGTPPTHDQPSAHTATTQRGTEPASTEPVVIEGDVVNPRVRRPLDLARLLLAIIAIASVAAIAFFATGTVTGLEEDLEGASRRLPDPVRFLLNLIGGLGILALPVAAAVDFLFRARGRQLLDALLALVLTVVILTSATVLISSFGSLQLILALAGSTSSSNAPLLPLLGGLVAFVTTGRLMARRAWATASVAVVTSLFFVSVFAGGTTVAGLGISVLVGWATGLAVRYALGTPTTRPSGEQVARTLAAAGFAVTELRAVETTEVGRRYGATLPGGPGLEVYVLDRDLEGAGLALAAWKSMRLRDPSNRTFNMRRTLEQRTLMAYASQIAGARTARLVVAREVSSDSSLLAYQKVAGTPFSELSESDMDDSALDQAWEQLAALRGAGMAHRSLTAGNLFLMPSHEVHLLGMGQGNVAASDVSQRIDIAELLCTLGLLVGPERAVASGERVLGAETLRLSLPVLQTVALSGETKRAMRSHKDLLVKLRDSLIELNPDAEVEHIELERFKPRTIIMIVLGSIAAYVLFAQLAEVDLVELFENANWWWLAVAFVGALLTYPGAAWSLTGFVPEHLKLRRTIAAQLAGDFATLVAPPTLGAVAINLRYLQKSGIHPALATASIGVAQVAALIVHVTLLLIFIVTAGTQQDFSIDPPTSVIFGVVALVVVLAGLLLLPPVRAMIWKRLGPLLKQVGPRMLTVAQTPAKILEGVGGMVALNVGYIICLAACVNAFGGTLSLAAVAVVYLTASVIGQAAPTPGGLGAVEAAMAAGLTAAGLDSGVALSAVLLYRVITFWMPTVPGWFAFNWLQRTGYL